MAFLPGFELLRYISKKAIILETLWVIGTILLDNLTSKPEMNFLGLRGEQKNQHANETELNLGGNKRKKNLR